MTEKQRKCIDWICETLGITYYGKDNKQDAWKFINKYIDRARKSDFYSAWGLNYFFRGSII